LALIFYAYLMYSLKKRTNCRSTSELINEKSVIKIQKL